MLLCVHGRVDIFREGWINIDIAAAVAAVSVVGVHSFFLNVTCAHEKGKKIEPGTHTRVNKKRPTTITHDENRRPEKKNAENRKVVK